MKSAVILWVVGICFVGVSCGGSKSGGSKTHEPNKAKQMATVSGAKTGNIPGATPMGISGGVTDGSRMVVPTSQAGDSGDMIWVLNEDIDEDGDVEEVHVLYDDETETTYLFWEEILAVDTDDDGEDDCLDDEGLVIVAVEDDGSYSVSTAATCDSTDFIIGCDFDADDTCQSCGACSAVNDELICETDLECPE